MNDNIEQKVMHSYQHKKMSTAVKVSLVSAMAAALAACSGAPAPQYTRVCVDGQQMVERDEKCEQQASQHRNSGTSPFMWYYLGRSGNSPQVYSPGMKVTGGSYAAPNAAYLTSKGHTITPPGAKPSVTRGVFGGSGSRSSGVGA